MELLKYAAHQERLSQNSFTPTCKHNIMSVLVFFGATRRGNPSWLPSFEIVSLWLPGFETISGGLPSNCE